MQYKSNKGRKKLKILCSPCSTSVNLLALFSFLSQTGQIFHGLMNGVGDVVELQVQKDLVAAVLDGADDVGAFAVEQLHADLHKGLLLLEFVQESQGICLILKNKGEENQI